jgi:DNA-binding NarL/FixJ family response regulator
MKPRILLADDHRMVAEGIKSLLSQDFELVGVVEDGRALIDAAQRLRPDVIVADISMPHLNGIAALEAMRTRNPDVKFVVLTMHPEVAYARRALQAGALGYVLKHAAPAELILAIRAALKGRTFITPALASELLHSARNGGAAAADPAAALTQRQREILQLMAEGRTAKEIADTLSISSRTVEFHKYRLMETLDLRTSADLIRFAIKHGIASP